MERLAKESGDIDELLAIKTQNPVSSASYLSIAKDLAEAKRFDEALEWAQHGVAVFPDQRNDRLRDFLVNAYIERNRIEEALQLTWIPFEEFPVLENYKKLKSVSGKLSVWSAQRERALRLPDEVITKGASSTTRWHTQPSVPDFSRRVSIALWEQDPDAALTTANQGRCDRALLIVLAGQLENVRPNEAIRLNRRVKPFFVGEAKNSAYEEAARLIRRIGNLMQIQNRQDEFGVYLAEIGHQFKPKRNFMKLLEKSGAKSLW